MALFQRSNLFWPLNLPVSNAFVLFVTIFSLPLFLFLFLTHLLSLSLCLFLSIIDVDYLRHGSIPSPVFFFFWKFEQNNLQNQPTIIKKKLNLSPTPRLRLRPSTLNRLSTRPIRLIRRPKSARCPVLHPQIQINSDGLNPPVRPPVSPALLPVHLYGKHHHTKIKLLSTQPSCTNVSLLSLDSDWSVTTSSALFSVSSRDHGRTCLTVFLLSNWQTGHFRLDSQSVELHKANMENRAQGGDASTQSAVAAAAASSALANALPLAQLLAKPGALSALGLSGLTALTSLSEILTGAAGAGAQSPAVQTTGVHRSGGRSGGGGGGGGYEPKVRSSTGSSSPPSSSVKKERNKFAPY